MGRVTPRERLAQMVGLWLRVDEVAGLVRYARGCPFLSGDGEGFGEAARSPG
jgi:hypothetical protein